MTRDAPLYVLGFAVAASVAVHVGAIGLLESFAHAAWRVIAVADEPPPLLSVTLVEAAPPIVPVQVAAATESTPPRATPRQPQARPTVGGTSASPPPAAEVSLPRRDTLRPSIDATVPPRETTPPDPPVSVTIATPASTQGGLAAVSEQAAPDPGLASAAGPVLAKADLATPPRGPASAPVAHRGNPAPVYPESARRDGREGLTIVEVLVSREGLPLDVKVATTSGVAALDGAAVAGVKRWQFTPAQRDHEAIDARIRIPVRFRLNNDGN